MKRLVHFVVPGRPQPAGSKRAFPYRKKATGKLGVRVTDANPKAAGWKQLVSLAASEAMGGSSALEGPVALRVEFFLQRPKGHLNSKGEVRPAAPTSPITKPDTTKLIRGLEDALKSICWIDDSQVVFQQARKHYCLGRERTEVWIETT